MDAFTPLPWEWFEFSGTPDAPPAAGMASLPTIDEGGAARTWRLQTGSARRRTVLARTLRLHASPGQPLRKTLLLLHGMGLSIATFHGVAPWLLRTHDLLLLDYSGLGCASCGLRPTASGWRGRLAVRELVDNAFHALDILRLPTADVGGNSLGGGMALVAALEQPARIRRIVLSNPACYPQALPRMYRWLRVPFLGEVLMTIMRPEKLIGGVEYIGYVDKARFLPDLRMRYLANMAPRANRFRLMHMIRALPAHEKDIAVAIHVPRLSEIQHPVLVCWGEQDPLLFPGAGQRLTEDLPHATYLPYPDLAHMPHEEAPERIGPAWADFLNHEPAP
jgi:pimeloyl-ACP methyl ester carboxylesterase